MRLTAGGKFATGLTVAMLAVTAAAQRGDAPVRAAERAADVAARAEARAAAAQERSASAQERAARASGVAAKALSTTAKAAEIGRRNGFGASAASRAQTLVASHYRRLSDLVRAQSVFLELLDREPVVRNQLIAIDPSPDVLRALRAVQFDVVSDDHVPELEVRFVTLRVPPGLSVGQAMQRARQIAPQTEISANHIHLQSSASEVSVSGAGLAQSSSGIKAAIGLIDGGVAANTFVRAVEQKGFVAGSPAANGHATAVASLAVGAGIKSAAPGAALLVADVYGSDPRGGNSLAVARALGWMISRKVPVVLISLVGPRNAIVERAVQKARSSGVYVVAPVGNAGPAAPPLFPASYPGVVGISAVDRRNRALIEAGRGAQVDFTGPGADIVAASGGDRLVKVRGTSFAAPLVAGRLLAARAAGEPMTALNRSAVDLGQRGRDPIFGNGLICGACRPTAK